jgi:pimeloyl-ACP methyl ester carboxylesterase
MTLIQPLPSPVGKENSQGTSPIPARCLLIHGLNSVPEYFDPLQQCLNRSGFSCQALRLPGHTGGTQALAAATWTEWLLAVDRATRAALEEFPQVILIGHSLGAALALAVASREPRVAGVVALCPPLRLQPGEIAAVCLARHLIPFVPGWLHDVPLKNPHLCRRLSRGHELIGNSADQIGRKSKADAGCRLTGGGINHTQGRDTDELPVQVHQRSTAVAWIDGGARLDESGQCASWPTWRLAGGTVEPTDDAKRDRLLQVERGTQSQHQLANSHARRVAEQDWSETARRHLKHC